VHVDDCDVQVSGLSRALELFEQIQADVAGIHAALARDDLASFRAHRQARNRHWAQLKAIVGGAA
jgi:hypothetical protein